MRTYKLLKETLPVENYVLYNLSTSERSAMAQVRFGILPLNKEIRNQPIDQRICNLGILNEIEDEFHFLFKSTLYNDLRGKWMENKVWINESFVQLDKISKIKNIFDKHHRCTTKFIHRNSKLEKKSFLNNCMCSFVCLYICLFVCSLTSMYCFMVYFQCCRLLLLDICLFMVTS